jgi:hypothetical protein
LNLCCGKAALSARIASATTKPRLPSEHHVSAQHLPLYLAEFDHRHNCRKMTDGERTDVGLTKAIGKRLIYRQ